MKRLFADLACLGIMIIFSSAVLAQYEKSAIKTFPIPNTLKIQWNWELVSFDMPAKDLPNNFQDQQYAIAIEGLVRPIQVEFLDSAGLTSSDVRKAQTARIWTIATLRGEKDINSEDGRRLPAPESSKAYLIRRPQGFQVEQPLQMRSDQQYYYIENQGLYTFRLRKFDHKQFNPPIALDDLPHFMGGLKVFGEKNYDGRAWFWGDAKVSRVSTEIVRQGPVYVDARVRIFFDKMEEPEGTVKAVRLANSKQTFRWKPGEFDWEQAPKYQQYYECVVRFVWGDGWIDFNDRYRLPGANNVFGMNNMSIHFGKPNDDMPAVPGFRPDEYMNLDTATWVRWFEWDTFGGNVDQKWVPLNQRPKQIGRPFAVMRPIWNQGGGGAQDFFFTRKPDNGDASNNEKLPFVGFVAAYPSKWTGMSGTMYGFAYDNCQAVVRFPLAQADQIWYVQRAFGLYAAPQKYGTQLNQIVRTHTDWTLNGQINKYILDWSDAKNRPNPKDCPTAGLYIERRYQDDFLNPTSRITRMTKNFAKLPPNSCSPENAALAYIYVDYDHWMGWQNLWGPGNPNFHTDKYMGAIYMAAAMKEHPHAKQWLQYGLKNYNEDVDKVFFEPDGVGFECPGYAGYSIGLQVQIAESLYKQGAGNTVENNPLFYKTSLWHRKLLTPIDPRLGFRHEAPLGDTHRWTSGMGSHFAKVAALLLEKEPQQAVELWSTAAELAKQGGLDPKSIEPYRDAFAQKSIPAFNQLDWSSQAFDGFGAVMRNRFGTDRESFAAIHAGRAAGHYHNDDPAFHLYLNGIPVALDYNCSYTPRGDHAALHNTLTFGNSGTIRTNEGNREVEAMEQAFGRSKCVLFKTSKPIDIFVSEKTTQGVALSPVKPEDAEFQRNYPSRDTEPITHKRVFALVKPSGASLNDFAVVRDIVDSSEPFQLNLHLLGRDLTELAPGLYRSEAQVERNGKPANIYVYVSQAEQIQKFESRVWYYWDVWMVSDKIKQSQYLEQKELDDPNGPAKQWAKQIAQSNGSALMVPKGWKSTWTYGEIQQWLRLYFKPETKQVTYVIYAADKKGNQPVFQTQEDGGIKVSIGNQSHVVNLDQELDQ